MERYEFCIIIDEEVFQSILMFRPTDALQSISDSSISILFVGVCTTSETLSVDHVAAIACEWSKALSPNFSSNFPNSSELFLVVTLRPWPPSNGVDAVLHPNIAYSVSWSRMSFGPGRVNFQTVCAAFWRECIVIKSLKGSRR